VIAVAEGRYDEAVSLGAGVTLVGACAEGTVLEQSVTLAGSGATLRDVTVEGASPGLRSSADATIEDVVISGAAGTAVRVEGGTLTGATLLVTGTRPGHAITVVAGAADFTRLVVDAPAGDGVHLASAGASVSLTAASVREAGGYGVFVGAGASATVSRASFERNEGASVYNRGATVVTDTVVRGEGPAAGRRGHGFEVAEGTLSLSRVLSSGSRWSGINLYGGSLEATDLVIADTAADPADGYSGYGFVAFGGDVSLSRVHLFRNAQCSATFENGTFDIADVRVVDTREGAPLAGGITVGCGMHFGSSSSATLSRVQIEGSFRYGLSMSGEGTVGRLGDLIIRDTTGATGDRSGGQGLVVADSSTIDAERVLIERSQFAAVTARRGATLRATDIAIRDVNAPNDYGISGYGFKVEHGGTVTFERALIERTTVAGIHVVNEDSELVGTDLVVRDMLGDQVFGLHGWGLGVTSGGRANVTRGQLSRSRYVGVVTAGPGSSFVARDLVLEDTLDAACADDLCADAPFGIGVGAYAGASVDIESFRIARSHVIGIQLAGGGAVDLNTGVVSMSPIGANVQAEEYVIDRLNRNVFYLDNEQNLVTDALPVPSVSGI
jgi:hypothetical protein